MAATQPPVTGRVADSVCIPTGVRVNNGSIIVTRYWVTRSWDVDWPVKALDRFARMHPHLQDRVRYRELRNQLLELEHVLVVRELARVVVGGWTGSPVPPWPEGHDSECCTCCEDERDEDGP